MKNIYLQKKDGGKAIIFVLIVAAFMLLFTCNPAPAKAQRVDSTHYVMITEAQALAYMSANLRNSHHEYKTAFITGCAASAIYYSSIKLLPEEMKTAGVYTSAALGLVSLILFYDSHNKIGRAGRIRLSPRGLVLLLTEKEARNVRK